MNLPYSDELNIGYLSRVFDRQRISTCYKYFWLLAILKNLSPEKTTFTYDDLLNEMIVRAWYMVTEFNLRLGPCNTTDHLEEVVKYIHTTYRFSSTETENTILDFLVNTEDPQIHEHKKYLINNVPYCLQSPFYDDIKSPSKAKMEEINKKAHLLYYFRAFQRLDTKVEINEEWVEYLVRNKEILKDWVNFHLIGYLQDRNPSVPGIADKISKPESRKLARVTKYWNLILEIDPSITDIYGNVPMHGEKISIDHFVPWQFVAHDELWNLSPTTKSINSQKSNRLPNWEDDFSKLANIEYRAYEICTNHKQAKERFAECAKYHVNNMEIRAALYSEGLSLKQFAERLENVMKPVYDSAKLCGFSEWIR